MKLVSMFIARRSRPVRVVLATTVSLFCAGLAQAQTTPPAQSAPAPQAPRPTLTIPRVQTPPKFEDYLPGGSHPGAAVTTFLQRDPKDLEPATEKTTAYLSYDDGHLYVGFVCDAKDRAKIRAHMEKREAVFSDDIVGVMIDTFLDKQRAYMFFVNPLGIQADGVTTAGSGDDLSFDTDWHSEGRVTDAGYVAWMAIPFKSLRFPSDAAGTQRWGLALFRQIPASDEADFWPGITNKLNGFIAQFGVVDGMTGVSPGRNIQMIPYGTFARARFLDFGKSGYVSRTDTRAGVDVKAVARDALTFDFTLNPDFSQVESDDPQVTVNQRFEVFFPEKRPFFLENSDIFDDTPSTLLFSRRIRDPQFGGRMTGKVGNWALGVVTADDRAPGRPTAEGGDGSGHRAFDTAVRVRNDFGESRVGFLGTARTFGATSNYVGSADARIRLSKQWVVTGQAVGSSTTSSTGQRTSGASAFADVSRSGRQFSYTLTYFDVSPHFTSPLGFFPRVDYRQLTDFFALRWFPKKGPIISFGPDSFVQGTWNYAGTLEDWTVRLPFQVNFKGQTSLFGRHALISETVGGVTLRQREDVLQVNTSYLRWLEVSVSVSHGTRPNYFPAGGAAPYLATYTDLFSGVTVRPTSALLIEETYLYSRLTARAGGPGSGQIFSNPIFRTRVNYQFSREWSLRAILDSNALTPNTSLVGFDRSRHRGVDLLLTWLAHPGTAIYVGYTDGYDNLRVDPVTGIQPTLNALASTGRQIFVKSSWLVRF